MKFWLAALAALTALRLVLAAVIPLSPDEAYYFIWSVHVQPGYYDHPPMVALLIRAGTALCGPTPLGVRLFGPLLAAAGSVLLWRAGQDLCPGRNAGLIAAALFNATILLGVGSIIMTPDTPLVFFWTAALAALGRLVATRDDRWWLAVGAAAGAALLSKYTGLMLVAGIGFWLLSRREGRERLKMIWPWAGLFLALLMFAPNIYWNATHDWVSYLKQGSRVTQFDLGRSVQFLVELVFGQIGLITPVGFGLAAAGLWRLRSARDGAASAGGSLILWLSLLPVAVFLEHVVSDRVQANWPAIMLPAAFLAAARLPAIETWLRPALGLGFGLTLLVYAQALAAPLPLPARLDPTALQFAGWKMMVAQIAATGPEFVTADDYATISELAYNAPGGIPVTGFGARWGFFGLPPADGLKNATGILVTRRTDAICPDLAGHVTRQRGGEIIATYRLCRTSALPGMLLVPRP